MKKIPTKDQIRSGGGIAQLIRIEQFYKRYKWILLLIVVIAIALGLFFFLEGVLKERRAQQAFKIYVQFQATGKAELLPELEKKSQELADLVYLQQAVQQGNPELLQKLESSKNEFISSFAKYENSVLKQDINLLGAQKGGFENLGKLQKAYLLMKDKHIQEAREILQSIPRNSSVKELATILSHYGVDQQAQSQPSDLEPKHDTNLTHGKNP